MAGGGHIQRLGDRKFRVHVFLGRNSAGKQKFHSHVVHGTKADAQQYLNGVLRERDLGTWIEPSAKTKQTLNQYLDFWLDNAVKGHVTERVYGKYRDYASYYIRPQVGEVRLDKLDAIAVQGVIQKMTERGLAPATVRDAHMVLSSALNQAVAWDLIPKNPADVRTKKVKLPKIKRKERPSLSLEQARVLIKAAAGHRWGALLVFAVVSGLRPGELQALIWEDIDWDTNTVYVKRAMEWPTPTTWKIGPPKTDAGTRNVLVPGFVLELLRQHRAHQAEERLKAGKWYQNHGFVFANEKGGPFNRKNVIRRALRPLLEAVGLDPSMRMYDLRHTAATVDMSLGTPPKVVSEKLGHTNPGFTLKTYSHVKPHLQQEAVDRLAAAYTQEPEPSAQQAGQVINLPRKSRKSR